MVTSREIKSVRQSTLFPWGKMFNLILELHDTVTQSIDTALSWDQLNSPPVNYTLVRPIVEKFSSGFTGDKYASGLLAVPTDPRESGSSQGQAPGQTGIEQVSMGGVLYALMANRFVFLVLIPVSF